MERLAQLKKKRYTIKTKLSIFTKFFLPLKTAYNQNIAIEEALLIELSSRLIAFKLTEDEFEEIQSEIEQLTDENELVAEFNEREEFTTTFCSNYALAKHISNLAQQQHEEKHVPSTSTSSIKLPTIDLPTYTGNFDSWLEFKDLYESLIHNNKQISDIQKYHYLRASLKGDALRPIQSLSFTAANYEVAWQILCGRYNNDDLLIHNHIKALYELPQLQKETYSALRNILDMVLKHVRALTALNQPVHYWDRVIIFFVQTKLDKNTASLWESHKKSLKEVSLQNLQDFIRSRADVLEAIQLNSNIKTEEKSKRVALVATAGRCNYCKGDHTIYSCQEFLALSVADRNHNVKSLKLCTNCLWSGHEVKKCRSSSCRNCKQRHNTLLHEDQPHQTSQVLLSSPATEQQILLSTAVVNISDSKGTMRPCRVLLDCGSQSNFISESMAKQLNLERTNANISIIGINSTSSSITQKCNVEIQSRTSPFKANIDCLLLSTIPSNFLQKPITLIPWNIPSNISLADPKFNIPEQIDLLIGAGLFWELLSNGKISLGKNMPTLQNTVLGWVISGTINTTKQETHSFLVQELSQENSKFWEIEEVLQNNIHSEDKQFEKHFRETTVRDSTGGFIVRLPLKNSPVNLGDSRTSCIKRFLTLERKFSSDVKLKEHYAAFINEYIRLGHMSLTTNNSSLCFLPHHAVFKHDSPTTKIQVVFDGSAKTSSGWSLNDIQHTGPTIQTDLLDILLRFRQFSIIVAADIEKMYRHILVQSDDRRLQTILWRDHPSKTIQAYQLNTITYGTSSVPYLAIRTLHQLATDSRNKYPKAAHIIANDFYEEDLELKCSIIALSAIDNSTNIIRRYSTLKKLKRITAYSQRFINNCRAKTGHCTNGNLTTGELDQALKFLIKICHRECLEEEIETLQSSKHFKGYIALFICFSTKAVHLEAVWDLTTDSFMCTLRRFISRRGRPCNIYSDNGSNFIGAGNQIKALYQFLEAKVNDLTNNCSEQSIKWHFIPANSPHFGGLWEAGVKSVKHHLVRSVGEAILTYEEFYTALVQIEAILNSRPLHPLFSDPNSLDPLTPAHFLIGRPLTTIPEPSVSDIPLNRLSRHQLLQQIRDSFWKRWTRDYLHQLQQKYKWTYPTTSLQPGDLVILKQENIFPLQWPLGRVEKVYPGNDNVVRVVDVKTAKGIFKRAINKVCPIPKCNI